MRKHDYAKKQPTSQQRVRVHSHEVRFVTAGGANVTIHRYGARSAERERLWAEAAGRVNVEVVSCTTISIG